MLVIYTISVLCPKNNPMIITQKGVQRAVEAAHMYGFNKVLAYNESVMTEAFRDRYHHILESSRGAGFWMWKPYAILHTLLYEADWGDYVCYVSERQKPH
jgi:hypothetical protein